jgi:hypothetical protein
MISTNSWILRRHAAIHCEELKQLADRARANPRRHRGRRPVTPERDTAYAVPKILGPDVLERLAALISALTRAAASRSHITLPIWCAAGMRPLIMRVESARRGSLVIVRAAQR